MKFLEKDLEEILWNELQTEKGIDNLTRRGLYIIKNTKAFRQLRIGGYGVSDIINVTKVGQNLHINIIELKKDKVSMSAFLQAVRYYKGIRRYLEFRNKTFDVIWHITLIGSEIDANSDFIFLSDFIEFRLSLVSYSYDVDGIRFNYHSGYSLKEEGFKS